MGRGGGGLKTTARGAGGQPFGFPDRWGATNSTAGEMATGPATHKCCLCPLASLPRRRGRCSTQSGSQGPEVWRVLSTSHVGRVANRGYCTQCLCWGELVDLPTCSSLKCTCFQGVTAHGSFFFSYQGTRTAPGRGLRANRWRLLADRGPATRRPQTPRPLHPCTPMCGSSRCGPPPPKGYYYCTVSPSGFTHVSFTFIAPAGITATYIWSNGNRMTPPPEI